MFDGGVMPGRAGKYNGKTPKEGSKRFNFVTKTSHFAHLDILFIYGREDTIFFFCFYLWQLVEQMTRNPAG